MTVNKLQSPVSGFTDGLNTEASALNVLPSEMMDGSINIELFQNGSVRRRRGVDFIGASDAGGFAQTVRVSTFAAEGKAEAANAIRVKLTAPNGSIVDRVVVDINNEFWVFESTNAALKNIDSPKQTLTRAFTHDNMKFQFMSFAQSGNRLYFTGKFSQPGYLKVASDNENLEIVYIDVLIRDPNATVANSVTKVGTDWYECIESHTSVTANDKPGSGTNWERYWFRKDGAAPAGVSAWANSTAYTTSIIKIYNKLNTPTATSTYPTTVDFFAGRVWLAGDPKNPNDLFFSHVVINDADIQQFMQHSDPFDSNDALLVDDDGGVISMQGVGLIKQILALGSSMFVGTNTGVSQISGADGIFKATNFSNHKVLTDGVDGGASMVRVENEFVLFAQNSIWLSEINTTAASTEVGKAAFRSISEERVETYYTSIPQANKEGARAVYSPSERRIFYFHSKNRTDFDKSFNGDNQPVYFTNALVVDTQFKQDVLETRQDPDNLRRRVNGAFFVYEFNDGADDGDVYITCPFISEDIPAANDTVVVGADVVQVSGVDVVTAANAEAKTVVLCLGMTRTTVLPTTTIAAAFATFNTSVLKDWFSDSAEDLSYTSKIITGFQTFGNVQPKKSILYGYFVFKKVESGVLDGNGEDLTPGGCLLQTAWNWTDLAAHPKYQTTGSQLYDATRFTYSLAGAGDDGESHTYRKHRVRGRGNTVYFVLTNDGDTDFHLIGWTQQFYGGRT